MKYTYLLKIIFRNKLLNIFKVLVGIVANRSGSLEGLKPPTLPHSKQLFQAPLKIKSSSNKYTK